MTGRPQKERPIRHGTVDGYTNRKCRCEACRDAWSFQHRDYMNYSGQADRHAQRERERYARKHGIQPAEPDKKCPGCGRLFVDLGLHAAQVRRREGNTACINQAAPVG